MFPAHERCQDPFPRLSQQQGPPRGGAPSKMEKALAHSPGVVVRLMVRGLQLGQRPLRKHGRVDQWILTLEEVVRVPADLVMRSGTVLWSLSTWGGLRGSFRDGRTK